MSTFEWVRMQDSQAVVGITQEAASEIGKIVHIELPKVGSRVEKGQEVVVLESTKAAIDLYSPLSGTISAINEALKKDVNLINTHATTDGWLYIIQTYSKTTIDSGGRASDTE